MSVEAIVSGQANVALFWEGDSLYSLHPGGEPVRRREREIAYLLGDAEDLLHFEGIDRPRVALELDLEVRRADALHLALMLLDTELEAETREEAAAELEELFTDARVSEYVENVLYSRPLPSEADIHGASEAARATSRIATYVSELVRHQKQITEAWIAWQGIPDDLFARPEDRQSILKTAIRSGAFRRLTRLLSQGKKVELFLEDSFANPEVRIIPNHREIWTWWIKPLREESRYRQPRGEELEVAEPEARSILAFRNGRRRVLTFAKGHYGPTSKARRVANLAVDKSLNYAYRDRRQRKRQMRALWVVRIHAAARVHGLSYSRLIAGLKAAGSTLDRKILADLAVIDPASFARLAERAKQALGESSPSEKEVAPGGEANAEAAEPYNTLQTTAKRGPKRNPRRWLRTG